jgi:hypothetical protein
MMSTSAIIGEEIDKQAALAKAALGDIAGVGPRAILDALGAYSATLYIAERVVESENFDPELVRSLHSKLLPLEHVADGILAAARQRGQFEGQDVAEPLRWLEICNEQVKDCMVAMEAMLDPQLDDLMGAALEEHRRGETVSLDSMG